LTRGVVMRQWQRPLCKEHACGVVVLNTSGLGQLQLGVLLYGGVSSNHDKLFPGSCTAIPHEQE